VSTPRLRSNCSVDLATLERCLNLIMDLCFEPLHRPRPSLEPGPYYHLEIWDKNESKYTNRYASKITSANSYIRSLLISVFLELNNCFQKTSWFLRTYEVEQMDVRLALKSAISSIEQASSSSTSEINIDTQPESENALQQNDGSQDVSHLMTRLEEICARYKSLKGPSQPRVPKIRIIF
jgi:hypothetical protein